MAQPIKQIFSHLFAVCPIVCFAMVVGAKSYNIAFGVRATFRK